MCEREREGDRDSHNYCLQVIKSFNNTADIHSLELIFIRLRDGGGREGGRERERERETETETERERERNAETETDTDKPRNRERERERYRERELCIFEFGSVKTEEKSPTHLISTYSAVSTQAVNRITNQVFRRVESSAVLLSNKVKQRLRSTFCQFFCFVFYLHP